jgi:hypothetical protein
MVANPRVGPQGNGITDFYVARFFKNEPLFANNKGVIELPRRIPIPDPKDPPKFIIFCDLFNGKLDPYRGVPVKSAPVLEYLEGAKALGGKDRTQALHYYFRWLDHNDDDIAQDAFLEFVHSSNQEIADAAKKFPVDRVRKLLQDPNIASERLSIYAFMLGVCGGDQDAAFLRKLIEDPSDRTGSALEGILSGYIHLRPRQGWNVAVAILADVRKPFVRRYAVLRTIRFYQAWKLAEYRQEILRALDVTVKAPDMADFAIDELLKLQRWEMTDRVLDLATKEAYSAPVVRRAILRFALRSPQMRALAFVQDQRRRDPEWVCDTEEMLSQQSDLPPTVPAPKK